MIISALFAFDILRADGAERVFAINIMQTMRPYKHWRWEINYNNFQCTHNDASTVKIQFCQLFLEWGREKNNQQVVTSFTQILELNVEFPKMALEIWDSILIWINLLQWLPQVPKNIIDRTSATNVWQSSKFKQTWNIFGEDKPKAGYFHVNFRETEKYHVNLWKCFVMRKIHRKHLPKWNTFLI